MKAPVAHGKAYGRRSNGRRGGTELKPHWVQKSSNAYESSVSSCLAECMDFRLIHRHFPFLRADMPMDGTVP